MINLEYESSRARRVKVLLYIDGRDMTEYIGDSVKSLTYTDVEEDSTDDIQVTLEDRDDTWLQDWLVRNVNAALQGGMAVNELTAAKSDTDDNDDTDDTDGEKSNVIAAQLSATIVVINDNDDEKTKSLDCGQFELDSLNLSFPPSVLTLKGTSIPYDSTAREQTKSRAWENVYLSEIHRQICSEDNMKAMYLPGINYDPYYDRVEQVNESDIILLQRLCKNEGMSLKASANNIVIFIEAAYEDAEPVAEIERNGTDIESYKFDTNLNDTYYRSCHVSYTNPDTGTVIEYTYQPRTSEQANPVLEINEKVKNREAARKLAMKRLREKNKKEYTCDIKLKGNVALIAGLTVMLSGFGAFDGKYLIEKAVHTVSSSGYTTQITVHLCTGTETEE